MSKKITGIIVSFLMAVAMLASIPKLATPVRADEGDQAALVMGPGVLATGVNTDDAQTVWYASGKTWRVISYGDSGNKFAKQSGVATLFASDNLETGKQFNPVENPVNDYEGSSLQGTVNGWFTSLFSEKEQKAVDERKLAVGEYDDSSDATWDNEVGRFYSAGVSGTPAKGFLWPLSTAEARAMESSSNSRELLKASDHWWLRSPGSHDDSAAIVYEYVSVSYLGLTVYGICGVRPAFWLNLKSVLFTSAAAGGKSSGDAGAGALTQIGTNNTNEWKVTLLDDGTITGLDGHKNFAVTASAVTYDSATGAVTVPYTGAVTGDNEYISAIITDSTGKTIKYYGRIAKASSASNASVTINTSGKLGDDDKLYVFNEQFNGDAEGDTPAKTDFASKLVEIKIRKNVTLTLSASNITYGADEKLTASGLPSDATGSVKFTVKGTKDTTEKEYTANVSGGKAELTLSKPDADSYSVTATYSGDDNYNTASTSKTFTVAQATPKPETPSGLTATAGQTLADVTLPTATDGTWTWQDAATTSVGDAGSNTFKATFTPTDTKNYKTLTDVEVTITVQEKKAYSFESGADGKWTSGSTDALGFVVKANRDDSETFEHFTGIQVDGVGVREKDDSGKANWTAKSGSVVIDLQPDYLKTLSAGEHTLTVLFDDPYTVDTTFTIEAAQEETKPTDTSPKTNDNNHLILWVVLMAAALAGGISIFVVALKRKQQ